MCDKSRGASVPISHDIGTLTRYCTLTRMPSHITLHNVAFDDVVIQWRRAYLITRIKLVEFTCFVIKTAFERLETPGNEINIYSYIINGLLHWYWWILSLDGISADARKLASFDIPTRDNIHQYQCNNPILRSYYIALNIKWLKCAIKAEELACWYHTILAHSILHTYLDAFSFYRYITLLLMTS